MGRTFFVSGDVTSPAVAVTTGTSAVSSEGISNRTEISMEQDMVMILAAETKEVSKTES